MAKQAAKTSRVYFDTTDLSGYVTAWGLNITQEVIPVVGLSTTGPEVVLGNYGHDANITAIGDYGETTVDSIMQAALDDDDHYLVILTSTSEGTVAYDQVCKVATEPQSAAVGDKTMMNLTVSGNNGHTRGVLLRSATVTGTDNGTGVNMGTTVSGDVFAVTYRVLSGTFTSITLQCQQSSDDGAVDTYAAITDLNSGAITAAGVVRKTTTGATEAWKRISVSAFSGTNAVILVTAGQVAGT